MELTRRLGTMVMMIASLMSMKRTINGVEKSGKPKPTIPWAKAEIAIIQTIKRSAVRDIKLIYLHYFKLEDRIREYLRGLSTNQAVKPARIFNMLATQKTSCQPPFAARILEKGIKRAAVPLAV